MDKQSISDLKAAIREIPGWPKKGILFYDLTTLLKQGHCLEKTIDALVDPYRGRHVDLVVGIEARGFIFAPAVAYALKAGFVPVRKPGKLPADKLKIEYELEYGMDSLEIHRDAIESGMRVLIVDDLIATGGTARAVAEMVERMGGVIVGLVFVVELTSLHGRSKLARYDVRSILQY
jgi:adenine phosphoribosyltransferase